MRPAIGKNRELIDDFRRVRAVTRVKRESSVNGTPRVILISCSMMLMVTAQRKIVRWKLSQPRDGNALTTCTSYVVKKKKGTKKTRGGRKKGKRECARYRRVNRPSTLFNKIFRSREEPLNLPSYKRLCRYNNVRPRRVRKRKRESWKPHLMGQVLKLA